MLVVVLESFHAKPNFCYVRLSLGFDNNRNTYLPKNVAFSMKRQDIAGKKSHGYKEDINLNVILLLIMNK